MDSERIDALARLLIDARERGEALDPVGDDLVPSSVAEAQAVDDRVAETSGWPVVGWKIGCTSEHAQKLLKSPGPFAGRVYTRFESGTTLDHSQLMTEPHLEGEFAFTIGDDLNPVQSSRDRGEVISAIHSVRPAIEIVGGRFVDFFNTPLHCLIADGGANSHLIVGEPVTDWDPDGLRSTAATMSIDGTVSGEGSGADVLGDPVEALAWLCENLSGRGITLRAGDVVTTGTATQVSSLPPGSTATVSLAGIGEATLTRASS